MTCIMQCQWGPEVDRMEKEAAALCLELAALHLKIWANHIKEEEAMADLLLVVCQEEEVAAGDQIRSQCHHLDHQHPLRMVV